MSDRLRKRIEGGGRQDGFTLIELLIVIVILGILAAIVVFAVGGITDKGSKSACKADLKSIETAAEAYYAQNNTPVASLAGLVPGFLHADPGIAANTKTVAGSNGYVITFVPGSGTTAGTASSNLAGCP
jgi:prepilin-type N-terminal cleavage/methylation domain-containing protein